MPPRSIAVAAALCGISVSLGCSTPVAGGLEQREANLVTDTLNQAGIEASKEPDPSDEGKYSVLVSRSETAAAISTLREQDLPPRPRPSLSDSSGALVPSPQSEHAQYIAGLSGELERTLSTLDGVVGARVHLALPPTQAALERPSEKPTASVLLKYQGASPPLPEADIRKLVAGAVTHLSAEDVTVVLVHHSLSTFSPTRGLVHFGPIVVTQGSALWLRIFLISALTLMLGLVTAVLYLWTQRRRQLRARPSREGNP